MISFFKPAPPASPLPANRLDPEYRRLRWQVFAGIFIGYAGYYLVRNNFSLAMPAILATAQGGTIIYFSMATSFSAAALGAEGLAADVRMLVGNGYVPGHADLALDLLRRTPAVRALFEARLAD